MRTTYKSIVLSLLLVGCSSGAKTSNSANNILQPVNPLDTKSSITIAVSEVVPLVNGAGGFINIPVLNNTNKNLTLKTAKMSNEKLEQHVDFAACKNLQHGLSCNIKINLPASATSSGIELNFVDDQGNIYSAAQLIEFSDSNYATSNGFSFNLDKINKISTTQDYLLTVPFFANQKFESVNVKSTFGVIHDFNCATGAESGSLCVATFKMPAGDYDNQIQISGVSQLNKPSQFAFNYTSSNSSVNYLSITSGPLVIESKDHSGQISLVNIGDDAINFSEGLDPALDGVSNLDFHNECGGSVSAHGICTVNLFKKSEDYTNVQNYNVTYDGDSPQTKITTPIYYKAGKAQNSGLEIVAPLANLTNTLVNGSLSTVLTVRNSGTSLVNDLKFVFDSAPSDMSVDEILSDCADSLESNSSCHYAISYTPKTATSGTNLYARYHLEGTDNNSVPVKTAHYFSYYSAIGLNGNSLQVNPSYIDVLMPADGSKKIEQITIANNGNHDFILKEVKISGDNSIMSTNDLVLPLTITAGQNKKLDLQFSSTIESIGRNQLLLAGSFADNNRYSGVLNADYMLSNSFATVSPPQYLDATGVAMPAEPHFELTAANYVDVVFHYSAPAGKSLSGFIINDSSIPMGFSPVKQTISPVQCPSYGQGDTTGIQLTSSGCSIAYRYVDPAQAIIEGMYDLLAEPTSLRAPEYAFQVSADIGLRFFHSNQVATLNPDPFIKVYTTDMNRTETPANVIINGAVWGVIHNLSFYVYDYNPNNKLGNADTGNVDIYLSAVDNQNIIASMPICGVVVDPVTKNGSCFIKVAIKNGYSVDSLKYKAYSHTAREFNSIYREATLYNN